jgi:DNA-binding transcriptional LysR family regulator
MQFHDLVSVPLIDPIVHRNLSLIMRSGRSLSPAARSFVEIAKSVIAATNI